MPILFYGRADFSDNNQRNLSPSAPFGGNLAITTLASLPDAQ